MHKSTVIGNESFPCAPGVNNSFIPQKLAGRTQRWPCGSARFDLHARSPALRDNVFFVGCLVGAKERKRLHITMQVWKVEKESTKQNNNKKTIKPDQK